MSNHTLLLIESYFAGTLTEAERSELKTLLANDAEAAAEFAWQQRLAGQVSQLSLSKSIQNDTNREATKPPFRSFIMNRTVWAAAAAVSLLAIAYYFLPSLMPVDKTAVMAESFEHFPNKMRFKNLGGEETASPDVLAAFAAYDQKNYNAAVPLLTEIVNANPTRMDYRFYLGVAELGRKRYAESINAFYPVAKDTNSAYSAPAHYFLGIGYANINDVKQAREHLQAYLDSEHGVTYRDKAKKLLRAIGN
jgi:tetratricopeptide (TPR) repeat protein